MRVVEDGDVPDGLAVPEVPEVENSLFNAMDEKERVDIFVYVKSTQASRENLDNVNIHEDIFLFWTFFLKNVIELLKQ